MKLDKKVLIPLYVSVAVLFIVIFISKCSDEEAVQPSAPVQDTVVVQKNAYGLSVDSLKEVKGIVEKHQTLSDLLLPHNVSFQRISDIAHMSKDTFDVRKINYGKNYTVYSHIDSVEHINYFVYEKDPINYVVFDLRDSIVVYNGQKEVTIKQRSVSGVITQSLYGTLQEKNVSDLLAIRLSEVYAWQIDFYAVQKGDNFRVLFNEKFVDGEFVGIGDVIAATFQHAGKDFYAFRYKQDNKEEFFDDKGNSLRKAFLKAPLKFTRISSRYSRRRFHPVLKRYRAHLGIDFAAPIGTPVQAVGDGVVAFAGYKGQAGRYVKIRHNGTYQSAYMHLSRYGKGIKAGKAVKQGDVIGYVGSSGLSTGPHLDFRFYRNGQAVNYLTQEFPSSIPITEKNKADFQTVVEYYRPIIDKIEL